MKKNFLIVLFLVLPLLLFATDNFNTKMKEYIGKEVEVIVTVVGGEFKFYDSILGILKHIGEDYIIIKSYDEDRNGKPYVEHEVIIPKDKFVRLIFSKDIVYSKK